MGGVVDEMSEEAASGLIESLLSVKQVQHVKNNFSGARAAFFTPISYGPIPRITQKGSSSAPPTTNGVNTARVQQLTELLTPREASVEYTGVDDPAYTEQLKKEQGDDPTYVEQLKKEQGDDPAYTEQLKKERSGQH